MGAAGLPLGIIGTVKLTISFSSFAVNVPFLVWNSFIFDALLGTGLIYRHVWEIHVQDRTVEMIDGTEAPILQSLQKEGSHLESYG